MEIHAAHGDLLSQFLSPLSNRRQDRWGGSLAHRARLLLDIVRGVRASVAPGFAVTVKLNSADFQRGGFSPEDARAVGALLAPLGVDLVELSGGSYEAPAMLGSAPDERTLAREACFLSFAQEIAQAATLPLMVTGGIRRRAVAQQGLDPVPQLRPISWSNKPLAATAHMAAVKHQLQRLASARPPRPEVSPLWALLGAQWEAWRQARRYRRWVSARDTGPALRTV